MNELETGIAQLLRRTGSAHGQYETTALNGVYDEDWAVWYANWAIQHGLNDLLETPVEPDALSQVMSDLHREHALDSRGLAWPEFYAHRLVEMSARAK